MLCVLTDGADLTLTEVDSLTRLNGRLTQGRTSIHVVELTARPEGGAPDALQRLAALNHGTYRRVPPPGAGGSPALGK
jgi:hypothetical protein